MNHSIARITVMDGESVIFKREPVYARMGIPETAVRRLTAPETVVETESAKLTGSAYAMKALKERTAAKGHAQTDAQV